jgi:fucose permease
VNYTVISLVFLAPFVGYGIAALLNNKVHMRFGQLGVAVIAPSCKITAYVITCVHPPYPVLPIIFMLAGFGNGLEDGGWNAWIGNMENANELLGFLHGCYGLGATISPLVATASTYQGSSLPEEVIANSPLTNSGNKGEPPLVHLLLSYGMHHLSFWGMFSSSQFSYTISHMM